MKQQKIEQVKRIVSNPGDKYVRCLATGKYYQNGIEISEKEWNRIKNKSVTINLGAGVKPE